MKRINRGLKKAKFMLFGTRGAWDDYILYFSDINAAKTEAYKRLNDGYTATLDDIDKGTTIELKLRHETDAKRNSHKNRKA